MQFAAAFLESRRYASMLGATTEFEKQDGLTYSARFRCACLRGPARGRPLPGASGRDARSFCFLGASPEARLPSRLLPPHRFPLPTVSHIRQLYFADSRIAFGMTSEPQFNYGGAWQ